MTDLSFERFREIFRRLVCFHWLNYDSLLAFGQYILNVASTNHGKTVFFNIVKIQISCK